MKNKKVSEEKKKQIWDFYIKTGSKMEVISDKFNLSKHCISKILSGFMVPKYSFSEENNSKDSVIIEPEAQAAKTKKERLEIEKAEQREILPELKPSIYAKVGGNVKKYDVSEKRTGRSKGTKRT